MVHLAWLAGFHHEADGGAQALADQMVVHGRAVASSAGIGDAVGADLAVGQDDDVDSRRAPPSRPARRARRSPSPCRPRPLRRHRSCRASPTSKCSRRRSMIARIFSRSSLVRIGWRTSSRLRAR